MSKSKLITCAEFQLFLDENPYYTPDHWRESHFSKGNGKKPILGLTANAAQAFCAWLTQHEGDTGWIYRLPEIGEVDDEESCWQINGKVIELLPPKIIKMTVSDWVIDPQHNIPSNLLTELVPLKHYNAQYFVHNQDLALALARARDRTAALVLDLASTRDRILVRALAIDRTSALASATDRTFALDLASTLIRALASVGDHALANALANAIVLARDRILDHTLDRALDSIDNLVNAYSQMTAVDKHPRISVDLYLQVARIVKGYIELAIIQDGNYRAYSPIRLLWEWGEVEGFRRGILLRAVKHYAQQPNKDLDSGEWETWKRELDELLQAYATLVMYEKRRTGEWQPFEGLRIVKARRKE